MIYRRFGYIHSRLLLNKQDELRELEASLRDMDLIDARSEHGALCLKSRELDEEREEVQRLGPRSALLEKIEQKTLQYGRLEKSLTLNIYYLTPSKKMKAEALFLQINCS